MNIKVLFLRLVGLIAAASLLAGCATATNPRDPIEPFNRAIFSFNEGVDRAVLKPVAQGYRAVLPEPVRAGVGNFFSNLEDLWIAVNQVLQGKITEGIQDTARFVFNSTIGMLGLIDIASDMGLPKHDEDLGQTLGRWGIASGAYIVLPFLGPSTVRDGAGRIADTQADIVWNIRHVPTRNTLAVTRGISDRADLLETVRILEEAALDKYGFIRDSYLQRRRSQVYDGDPPREPGNASSEDRGAGTVAGTEPASDGASAPLAGQPAADREASQPEPAPASQAQLVMDVRNGAAGAAR